MKSFFLFVAILISTGAQAKTPKFSAFADGDDLHVTILYDCNHITGSLSVSGICRDDRLTKNFVETCEAVLRVSGTEMACPAVKHTPKTFTLSLAEEKVAKEAKSLVLKYQGQTIEVQLKD
ncbi:MAG: hypothetical protein V4596_09230 [Bdellovibrionota bacterium]